MLKKAGFDVVGPAGIVAEALKLVSTEGCDAAILDVNLGGGTSAPIADELRERGTPFLVLSGYTRTIIPPSCRRRPGWQSRLSRLRSCENWLG
jgi:DNA-binding response OmpR family regulator